MQNTLSGGSIKMNRWIVMGVVTFGIFIVNQSGADVLARYNFNGRTGAG